jgi:hypothetical protein
MCLNVNHQWANVPVLQAKVIRDVERRKLRLVQEIEAFSSAVTDMQVKDTPLH